jgi:glycosyltransferase involved in cell wall biosynthesis
MQSEICYICDVIGNADIDRCNALVARGERVNVFQWRASTKEYIWEKSIEKLFSVSTVLESDSTRLWSTFHQLLLLIKRCLVAQADTYIIYGYQKPYLLVLAVTLKIFGRVVVSLNDSKFDDYERNYFRDLFKSVFLLPYDGFLAASRRAESYLRYLGKRNIGIYHCAIDLERVAFQNAGLINQETRFEDRHFIMIARYLPKKNHATILRAYEMYALQSANPRQLVLCGYGPLEDDIRSTIAKSSILSRYVQLLGYTEPQRIIMLLQSSLALLLPSYEEQFGIVVVEALANSIPVIISEQCGAGDLVDTTINGFKLEPFNYRGFAYYMTLLSENEPLWTRMRIACPGYAERANVSVFCDALSELRASISENPRSKPNTSAATNSRQLQRIAVIYHFFPHYRRPILRELNASDCYKYEFWGSHDKFDGIEPYVGEQDLIINQLSTRLTRRGRYSVSGYWKPLFDGKISALIILGNPNILATWLIAAVGRLLGKKILFWSHGWLRKENCFKALARRFYFRLSHRVLVYNERAREIGIASGYPKNLIKVVYNSLDWLTAQQLIGGFDEAAVKSERSRYLPNQSYALLVCVARHTEACRFDLLLTAMAKLDKQSRKFALVLVGDGPKRMALEEQAQQLGLCVYFTGAIYDEARLSTLIYSADVTVSPGKSGLTAIHSLMYGTPVITHGDFDVQMPESEAIVPGKSGLFFRSGDADDLARAIKEWIFTIRERSETRMHCQIAIREKWNAATQKNLIEEALNELLGR